MTTERHIQITLRLPDRILSPNARPHWAAKAKAAKNYRATARATAMAAMGRARPPRWTRAIVTLRWFAKTATHPDGDNAVAMMKAALDGLTDAGVFADDRAVAVLSPTFAVDRDNPRVEVVITPLSGNCG